MSTWIYLDSIEAIALKEKINRCEWDYKKIQYDYVFSQYLLLEHGVKECYSDDLHRGRLIGYSIADESKFLMFNLKYT